MFEMFTSLTIEISLCEQFRVHRRVLVADSTDFCLCHVSLAADDIEETFSSLIGLEGLFVLVALEVGVGDGEHVSSPF